VTHPPRSEGLTNLTVSHGAANPPDCPICVVIISVHSHANAADAVRSILMNHDADNAEIAVVNTGKGSLRDRLGTLLERITLIETPTRLYPGGARNLGIRFTSAKIVSFLASDCMADQNWLRNRLKSHSTNRTVASAVRPFLECGDEGSVATLASYISIHRHRMPELSHPAEAMFGLSYYREDLGTAGLFNEAVRVGEDALINAELRRHSPPKWDPEVLTLHRYPRTMSQAIRDQYLRGRRESRFGIERQGAWPTTLFCRNAVRALSTPAMLLMNQSTRKRYSLVTLFYASFLYVCRGLGNLFPTPSKPHTQASLD
jgi:hypothetical protein